MNKTLLYIRHAYHSKTKSNDFLIDILKETYDITIFDINPYIQDFDSALKNSPIKDVDVLLLFQLPISGDLIKKYINFKKGVFFPMYDGAPSERDRIWLSYKDFNIINFSKTLYNKLKQMGLSVFYIQYFPKPFEYKNSGDINSAFFWQRITKNNINTVNKILKTLKVNNVHIHKAIDPNQNFIEPKGNDFNISYSNWYKDKKEMLQDIEKSSIYIAPREKEGIGMSFLEAMAMGRCVISPDNPTMNEYIKDGVTGILYDIKKPKISKKYDILKIQKNAYTYAGGGYKKWEKEKCKILDFIEFEVNIDNEKLSKWHFRKEKKKSIFKKIFLVIKDKIRKK